VSGLLNPHRGGCLFEPGRPSCHNRGNLNKGRTIVRKALYEIAEYALIVLAFWQLFANYMYDQFS
jgi:hypothetical protein